jgi:hypothetical protein
LSQNGKLNEDPAILLPWALPQDHDPVGKVVDELRAVVPEHDVVQNCADRWFDRFHASR